MQEENFYEIIIKNDFEDSLDINKVLLKCTCGSGLNCNNVIVRRYIGFKIYYISFLCFDCKKTIKVITDFMIGEI